MTFNEYKELYPTERDQYEAIISIQKETIKKMEITIAIQKETIELYKSIMTNNEEFLDEMRDHQFKQAIGLNSISDDLVEINETINTINNRIGT